MTEPPVRTPAEAAAIKPLLLAGADALRRNGVVPAPEAAVIVERVLRLAASACGSNLDGAPAGGTSSKTYGAPPAGDPFLGSGEVARLLGVKPRRVRQLATSLGGRQIGKRWVFRREEVERERSRRAGRGDRPVAAA